MALEKGGRTGNYPAASTMRDGVLYGGAVAVDSANTAAGGWRAWTLVPSIIIFPVVVLVLAQGGGLAQGALCLCHMDANLRLLNPRTVPRRNHL